MRAHLLLLAVAMLWGVTFVLVKDALVDITPLLFNLVRMVAAFLCMAAVYRRHFSKLNRRAVWSGAAVGFFLAAGYQFQTAGLARTTPSKTAFITGLVVVLVPLLAAIPGLRSAGVRAPRWNVWTAAVLAFAGIALLTVPKAVNGMPSSGLPIVSGLHDINLGDLLTLCCAIAFAFHCIALSRTSERVPFEQLALLQIGFAAIFIGISTPLLEHSAMHVTTRLMVAIALTAVLGTAAAFSIQSWAQQFLPASHTVLILSLEPVFAAITSFLFLGERLGLRGGMGALLVLGAIALTELTPSPAFGKSDAAAHTAQPTSHESIVR